jgi:RNA polymerase sigma-70 factor (ECF subfamily)
MTEEELITLLRSSDSSSIKPVFDRYHAALCFTAFKILKDHDQAKDIVQDVFIKIWNARHNLNITSLEAYLKRATINTALNYLEQRDRYKKEPIQESTLLSRATNTVSDELSMNELSTHANNAINNLPPRTRTVFTLIRSEEMSYREVAETLGISIKAVEKEMIKALKLLRESLRSFLNSFALFLMLNYFS